MRADRLLAIMLLLQTRGKLTAQRLADELEVSRRTILRDINALSTAGIPIYADGGHGGGITLDENYRTTLAGMRENEIRTLFISDNAPLLGEVGLRDAAESTLFKLRAVLPVSHRPAVEQMRQRILIDPVWWWRDAQPLAIWDQLQQAVFEDWRIRVVYERHDGEVIERVLEPYSLVAKSSVWYLVAKHGEDLRTYRVTRFRQVTRLSTRFERQADFDLPTYWHEQLQDFSALVSDYHFILRIRPEGMNFVKEIVPGRYHQMSAADQDRWITVQFHLESIDLAKMLVFGLGERAVVIEPPDLHSAILETARGILNTHLQGV